MISAENVGFHIALETWYLEEKRILNMRTCMPCLNILGIIVCPAFMLSFIPAFIDPHQEYFVNAGITKLSILWPATSRLYINGRYLLISITTIIATNYFFITYWLHVGLWNVSLSSIFSIMKNIDLLFNLK